LVPGAAEKRAKSRPDLRMHEVYAGVPPQLFAVNVIFTVDDKKNGADR
jgi:hypothetical protein